MECGYQQHKLCQLQQHCNYFSLIYSYINYRTFWARFLNYHINVLLRLDHSYQECFLITQEVTPITTYTIYPNLNFRPPVPIKQLVG